ncbi:MAG: LPP20 family lipoprotein [Armatimonadetes bacterium]|nr:LPP20 family lipoprotein [Armatimonadota bacterium]
MYAARVLAATLAVAALLAAPSMTEPIIEKAPGVKGEVNWSEGVLQANGVGVRPRDAESEAQARLLARRAAIADAYRNLAQLINEVRVTADTTADQYITRSDQIRMRVDAYIRGAQVIEEEDDESQGIYTVTMALPMAGGGALTGIMLPHVVKRTRPPAPVLPSAAPAPEPTPPAAAPAPAVPALPPAPTARATLDLESELLTPADARGPFTGLIVDTRGLGVEPSMSARIYDPAGREVYGAERVDPDAVVAQGMAGYMGTIRAALRSPRVGSRPLVLRAAATVDEFRRYVAISAEDAQRVLAENGPVQFLQQCAVVLVVDERRARDEAK